MGMQCILKLGIWLKLIFLFLFYFFICYTLWSPIQRSVCVHQAFNHCATAAVHIGLSLLQAFQAVFSFTSSASGLTRESLGTTGVSSGAFKSS